LAHVAFRSQTRCGRRHHDRVAEVELRLVDRSQRGLKIVLLAVVAAHLLDRAECPLAAWTQRVLVSRLARETPAGAPKSFRILGVEPFETVASGEPCARSPGCAEIGGAKRPRAAGAHLPLRCRGRVRLVERDLILRRVDGKQALPDFDVLIVRDQTSATGPATSGATPIT
jgi:hypothetical protein